MGNKPPGGKPSKESQANQVMESGELDGSGGSGGGSGEKSLRIRLIKLQPSIVSQARVGDTVEVRWQNGSYEVLRAGQLLGTVPGSYKLRLLPLTLYQATIMERTQSPLNVVIEVAK